MTDLVIRLDEAIARFTRPDDTVFLDWGASAGVRALVRAYQRQGQLTAVATFGGRVLFDLIQAGVVKRIITASLQNPFVGSLARIAVVQSDLLQSTDGYEPWSLYSLAQRLMAGALGWPFVPTRSLAGSSIGAGSPELARIEVPFGTAGSATVLAPLVPDVAIVHAVAADCYGRALFTPPYTSGFWGPRASRRGVIVTTEQVVPTESVKDHPRLRMLPAGRVLAVCEAPFGRHPYRYLIGPNGPGAGYWEDRAYFAEYSRAIQDSSAHSAWIDEWIVAPGDEEGYRRKAGAARLDALRMAPAPERVKSDTVDSTASPGSEHPSEAAHRDVAAQLIDLDPELRISVLTARRIVELVRAQGVRTILVGNGPSFAAAVIARHMLRGTELSTEFMIGTGVLDTDPAEGSNVGMERTAGWMAGVDEAYGVNVGGMGPSLALLSAAELDRHGALNSSFLRKANGETLVLAGSGGANDAGSLADHVIVVAPYRKGRYVRDVSYATCGPDRVRWVISDAVVLAKPQPHAPLALSSYVGDGRQVADIATDFGWPDSDHPTATVEPDLSAEEVAVLSSMKVESIRGR